jgi:hypothetical protein
MLVYHGPVRYWSWRSWGGLGLVSLLLLLLPLTGIIYVAADMVASGAVAATTSQLPYDPSISSLSLSATSVAYSPSLLSKQYLTDAFGVRPHAPSIQLIESQQRQALITLYSALGGPHWFNAWNLSSPIKTWYGIGLEVTLTKVILIDLKSNGLQGESVLQFGIVRHFALSQERFRRRSAY